jgi:hypothetical protein
MDGLIKKNHELDAKTREYAKLLDECAECERVYHVALARKALEMKSEGQSATFINSYIKGNKNVADLRFDYHVAEAKQKACLQAIKDIRVMIDSYRSLLAWEKAARTEL